MRPPIILLPLDPDTRYLLDAAGLLSAVVTENWWRHHGLAQRAVELINFDRRAAAQPEAGRVFRR